MQTVDSVRGFSFEPYAEPEMLSGRVVEFEVTFGRWVRASMMALRTAIIGAALDMDVPGLERIATARDPGPRAARRLILGTL